MAYSHLNTRRSTVITFKEMIKHLIDKVSSVDEFYEMVGVSENSFDMEKAVIHFWRRLCSADFMKDLYSTDDVLLKNDDFNYTWLWSREKAEWLDQRLSELGDHEDIADEEISKEMSV